MFFYENESIVLKKHLFRKKIGSRSDIQKSDHRVSQCHTDSALGKIFNANASIDIFI